MRTLMTALDSNVRGAVEEQPVVTLRKMCIRLAEGKRLHPEDNTCTLQHPQAREVGL